MILRIFQTTVKIKLLVLFSFVMPGCQSVKNEEKVIRLENLSSDNGQLDLSQFSFEQQKKERDAAANSLIEIRQNRIIILKEEIEIDISKNNINIASYARRTENLIGEKIYRRPKRKKETLRKCSHFSTSDDAQRFFLSKGGPQTDLFNLDSDGDGFACNWNPAPFRAIVIPYESETN